MSCNTQPTPQLRSSEQLLSTKTPKVTLLKDTHEI